MSDKIAEIRARHEVDAKIATVLNPELPPTWTLAGWRAHDDRATLLAEVERLREALRDIERGDYSDPMCVRTPEQRAREALEAKP